jgi:hypothetical protein
MTLKKQKLNMKLFSSLTAISFLSTILISCGSDSDSPSENKSNFDKSTMIKNYGVLIGELADDFKIKSENLKNSFSDFNKTEAQANWKEVASSYKALQTILQTDKSQSTGENYTITTDGIQPIYLAVDAWRMGQNQKNYEVQAIDRTEWLLFSPWVVSGESEEIHQNSLDTTQISSEGIAQSEKLIESAEAIQTHWSSAGKLEEMKKNEDETVEYIANRIFEYIGRLKDEHIGRASGLIKETNGEKAPSKVESPSAKYSKEEALALLEGMRNIYIGGSGLGIDDLLIQSGYSSYNDEVLNAFDDSISKLNSIDKTLFDAILNDFSSVSSVFESLQELEKVFNTNVITLMSVSSDMEFTNDGDSTF